MRRARRVLPVSSTSESTLLFTQLASPYLFSRGREREGQPGSKSWPATRSDLQPTPATMARHHLLLFLPLLALAFSLVVAAPEVPNSCCSLSKSFICRPLTRSIRMLPQRQGDAAAFIDGASHRYLRDQQEDQVQSPVILSLSLRTNLLLRATKF